MNWRKEIGASDGIKTIEKEKMIMSGIAMIGNLADPAHTRGGIILGNHADIGLGPTPEDHIDAETVPTQGQGVAPTKSFSFPRIEPTKTPFTFVRICWPRFGLSRGSKAIQCSYGCHESSPAQGYSAAVLGRD